MEGIRSTKYLYQCWREKMTIEQCSNCGDKISDEDAMKFMTYLDLQLGKELEGIMQGKYSHRMIASQLARVIGELLPQQDNPIVALQDWINIVLLHSGLEMQLCVKEKSLDAKN
jgi:hypothetical protein